MVRFSMAYLRARSIYFTSIIIKMTSCRQIQILSILGTRNQLVTKEKSNDLIL